MTQVASTQVKNWYRRHKLVRVTHVMHPWIEAALQATLQELGLSGRLHTAFSEWVNLTLRDAGVSTGTSHPGYSPTSATSAGSLRMVASLRSFRAPSRSAASGTCTAARTRWQEDGTTLPAVDARHGCWQNPSPMDGARSALVPLAKGFRLSAHEARCGCRVMSRRDE